MDIEEIKSVLPPNVRRSIPQAVIDNIGNVITDPELAEQFRENFLSYSKVLQEGKFKLESYVDAIKYVCFKFQDRTNQDAYARTFPDRMARFAAEGKTAKDISAYVAAYHKSKLVTRIMEEAITPMWLLNRDNFQKAVNVQVDLMTNSKSDLVRTQAANSLLNHLKQPETKKIELDIGVKEDTTLEALKEQMAALAQKQLEALQQGAVNTVDIANSVLIEGEAVREE